MGTHFHQGHADFFVCVYAIRFLFFFCLCVSEILFSLKDGKKGRAPEVSHLEQSY